MSTNQNAKIENPPVVSKVEGAAAVISSRYCVPQVRRMVRYRCVGETGVGATKTIQETGDQSKAHGPGTKTQAERGTNDHPGPYNQAQTSEDEDFMPMNPHHLILVRSYFVHSSRITNRDHADATAS